LLCAGVACAALALPSSSLGATFTPNSVEDDFLNDANCELREAVIAANTDGVFQGCTAADDGPDTINLANGAVYKRELADGGADEDAGVNGDLDVVDAPAGQEEDLTISAPGAAGATIRGNVIAAYGRVLHVVSTGATLTLHRVEIESGRSLAGTGGGGGILNLGTVNLSESLVTLNTSESSGGGIENAGTVNATNSTIQGNFAWESGGGLDNFLGTTTLSNVTVAHNQANTNAATDPDGVAGGIRQFGGAIQLRNTIVADNSQAFLAFPGPVPDCSGTPTSLGYNLIGNTAGCGFAPIAGQDVTNTSSGLAFGLAENGGPTRTVALTTGLAIEGGNPGTPGTGGNTCAATDQRGVARPQGPRCDIGAFEAPPAPAGPGTSPGIPTTTNAALLAAALKKCKKKPKKKRKKCRKKARARFG
jgi:hypothetical protein